MRRTFYRLVAGAGLVFLAPPAMLYSEDAVLIDGRHLHGQLTLNGDRLLFTPAAGSGDPRRAPEALAWDRIDRIRLPTSESPPLRALLVQRVELPGGQRLTGEFIGLDAREVEFRTTWAGRFAIPRAAVVGLTHLPGFVPVVGDDFEAGLKLWNLTGTPTLTARQQTSGRHSLRLDSAGQGAECSLPVPLDAGRIGVNFLEVSPAAGARWLVEADFAGDSGPRQVQAVLAGPGSNYSALVREAPALSERVPRTPGWHRLQIEFGPGLLGVTVDDTVLWFSRRHGPSGPLRKVRLACVAVADAGPVRGEMAFDDFCVARAVARLNHTVADLRQDELWLLSGDQLLGAVVRADRRAIELHGRFGERTFAWSDVRGIFPRQEAVPPRTTSGEQVRLWLRTGCGTEVDVVDGTVEALDTRRLVLRHALLGPLTIDRAHVRRLRRLFYGERVDLDHGPHHLGPAGRVASDLVPPRAEGVSLRRTFRLEAVTGEAVLRLQVTGLKESDGRADVLLNGRVVDDLNRHVGHAGREPRRLGLTLPADCLRAGENELEVRLTPERATGRYGHCGLSMITLEVRR